MTRTSHRGYILNWTKIDPVVSAQKSFEYVDGRTDDGRTDDEGPLYPISSPMSVWLSCS